MNSSLISKISLSFTFIFFFRLLFSTFPEFRHVAWQWIVPNKVCLSRGKENFLKGTSPLIPCIATLFFVMCFLAFPLSFCVLSSKIAHKNPPKRQVNTKQICFCLKESVSDHEKIWQLRRTKKKRWKEKTKQALFFFFAFFLRFSFAIFPRAHCESERWKPSTFSSVLPCTRFFVQCFDAFFWC